MNSIALKSIPAYLKNEFKKLGEDIRCARIRRKLTVVQFAEIVHVSKGTVNRMQKGSPNIAIGIYGRALAVLGLRNRIGMMADISDDPISRDLEMEALPKRVRLKKGRT